MSAEGSLLALVDRARASAERGAAFLDAARSHDLSTEAEQSLIGALLMDASALARVNGLHPGHFADERHRMAFAAIQDEREDSGAVDVLTVAERIARNTGKIDGALVAYLGGLQQNTPSAAHVERYAAIVRDHARRRELAALGNEIAHRAARGDLDELRRELRARLDAADSGGALPAALDLRVLAEREPEAPRHIVPDWLPAGEVTLLAGHGGAGKSIIALFLAVCIAFGLLWCGIPTARRRVTYLSAEDGADVLHWRGARIAAHLGVALGDLADWLHIIDASHIDAELMIEPGRGEEPTLSAHYDELRERVRSDDVVILDGASDLYGASEIVRRHVRRYVRALRRLIGPDGALLLLAHVDKAAARDGSATDRYSGSTAWHNSVRSRWSLAAEGNSDALLLTLAKANHAKAGAEIRLRWNAGAHLYLPDGPRADGGIVGAIRDRTEREGIMAAMRACAEAGIIVPAATTGQRTAYHVLRAQPAFPARLAAEDRAARRDFWRAVEGMRASGAIREHQIRAQHRHSVAALELAAGAS